MNPTPDQPTGMNELREILAKAFNDYYGYITEQDIIKAAHEYSEKTVFTEAEAAIQGIVERCMPEKLPEWYTAPGGQYVQNKDYCNFNAGVTVFRHNLQQAGLLRGDEDK